MNTWTSGMWASTASDLVKVGWVWRNPASHGSRWPPLWGWSWTESQDVRSTPMDYWASRKTPTTRMADNWCLRRWQLDSAEKWLQPATWFPATLVCPIQLTLPDLLISLLPLQKSDMRFHPWEFSKRQEWRQFGEIILNWMVTEIIICEFDTDILSQMGAHWIVLNFIVPL